MLTLTPATTRFLYAELTGQPSNIPAAYPPMPATGSKSYMEFKPGMLGPRTSSGTSPNGVSSINDPWGQSYGYSTAHSVNASLGYNPTYDLWSLAGKTANPQTAWSQKLVIRLRFFTPGAPSRRQ
jgi:hypothetical protein